MSDALKIFCIYGDLTKLDRLNQNTILLCNRSGKDRRVKNGFNLRYLFYGGKRAKIRRQQDINTIFVDGRNYDPISKESVLFGMQKNNAEFNKPVCLKDIPQPPRVLDYISKTKTTRYA